MVVSWCVLFEILSIVFCLHYLYGEKPQLDKITVAYIIIDIVLMTYINMYGLNQSWTLIVYFMMGVYCGCRFGFKFKVIFVNVILNIIILCPLQATMIIISHIFWNGFPLIAQVFANVLLFCIVILGLRKCNLQKVANILQEKEAIVMTAIGIVFLCILLFLIKFKKNIGFDFLYYIIFVASIVMISLVIVDIGKHKMRVKEAEAELRMHKLYEESFQSLVDQICAKQHEFDNHINAIFSQHFLYNSYDELVKVQKEYCNVIMYENKYNKLLKKGNAVILGFLYGKLLELDKEGIIVDYKINIGDLECKVPVYRMVELLGNLINNAREELACHDNINKLYIHMHENDDEISIEVRNQVNEVKYFEVQDFFAKGYSSKKRKSGYGLYNVKKICEEYNADVSCQYTESEGEDWIMFKILINKAL